MDYDSKGRIMKVEKKEECDVCSDCGHSVCNSCGMDMPICWDVVCHECRRTFCYRCTITLQAGHEDIWICKECSARLLKAKRHAWWENLKETFKNFLSAF